MIGLSVNIMRKPAGVPGFLFCFLLVFLLFQTDVRSAESESSDGQSEHEQKPQNQYTIKQAFRMLTDTMFMYERGQYGDISRLYELIELPSSIKNDFRDNYLIGAANRLYMVLQNVNYDPDDIPVNVPGDRRSVQLGREGELQAAFEMVKTVGGGWRFSAETADDPKIKKIASNLRARDEKLSRADEDGDTFEWDLMSPYRTVRTLFDGVLGRGGYTLKDAVNTLDFSEMDEAVRKALGPSVAVALYRVLEFRSPLDMSQLSADPQTTRNPILLVDPKYGVISMDVVENPKTGYKEWKFTPISTMVAVDVYETYMAEGMARMVQEKPSHMSGKHLPLQILVDDWVWKFFPELQNKTLGCRVWKWLLLLTILFVTPILLKLIRFVVIRTCRGLGDFKSKRTTPPGHRLILPLQIAVVSGLWLQGILIVTINLILIEISALLLQIIIVVCAVWLSWIVVEFVATGLMGAGGTSVKGTVALVVSRILKIALVVTGLIQIASLFGQDSTRILTALGIGGVALALAGKDTVENFFGTFMILSTGPFAIGDWICVDDFEGTVENVGIRSTAVRTFYNSLVNVPNATFIKTPVDNMGKRIYRRYKTDIHLRFDTPPDLIVSFMEGIRELVRTHPHTRKDFFIIRLHDFEHSSFKILIYVFFRTEDWGKELEERERFIVDVLRLAEMMGVKFAYPARRVMMHREKEMESVLPQRAEALRLGREAASAVGKKNLDRR